MICLRFLPYKNKFKNTKFISYAASVAESLSEEQWKTIIKRTDHFDAVSLREAEATEQYNKYNPGKAVTVLDPVFLLSKRNGIVELGTINIWKRIVTFYAILLDTEV